MIIPIRCFNCGQVLSSKYNTYKNLLNSPELVLKKKNNSVFFVSTEKLKALGETWDKSDVVTLDNRQEKINEVLSKIEEYHNTNKDSDIKDEESNDDLNLPTTGANNIEALLLKQTGIKRYCCKSILISHVDILDKL